MDILKSLLQGNGGGMLGALLPLLLGKGGSGDISSILSMLGKSAPQGEAKGQDFPPLFAESKPTESALGSIMPLLQSMMGQHGSAEKPAAASTEIGQTYPYELQYNHPES